jgi:uncharacterized membrane protein YebE (DUF533 family)
MKLKIDDLLGSLVQSGLTKSTTGRLKNSAKDGGLLDSLKDILGGGSSSNDQQAQTQSQDGGLLDSLKDIIGGGSPSNDRQAQTQSQDGGILGGMLKNVLGGAGRAVGGNKNLALGGLGALLGALFSGKKARGGALGGGLMALLGAIAFQALKSKAGQGARVPLGLQAPQNRAEEKELRQNSELVLKAMINAAKADGQIDEDEMQRILGKVQESGIDKKTQNYLLAEMKKPMETATLIAAAAGRPELAAQMYAATLLAIEVDTPAEKKYLDQLAAGLGLTSDVAQRIHQAVGLQTA